ncbi:MAG: DUF6249 domain-containing protein [Bacteroidales bacterium]|jgi:coproporphyrinogen III oxidase|nr:DUF6249 domain-containing protein [Bacteroidales bacterium]
MFLICAFDNVSLVWGTLIFVAVYMLVLAAIIVWYRRSLNETRYRLQAELYAKAIEKGQNPSDIPNIFVSKPRLDRYLAAGITFIAMGVGSVFVDWYREDLTDSIWLFPTTIGGGFLLVYFIVKRQLKREPVDKK